MKRRSGFTLIEVIVSTALLGIAMSIVLVATIGVNGLLQRTELRSMLAESGRAISDLVGRITADSVVGAVNVIPQAEIGSGYYAAVQVVTFSQEQGERICNVIGRAKSTITNGEEKFLIDKAGTIIAYWVYPVDSSGLCPSDYLNQARAPLYQNRVTAKGVITDKLDFSITTISCVDCKTKQLLNFSYVLDLVKSTGNTQSISALIESNSSVAVGLKGGQALPLTIQTELLPNALTCLNYSTTLVAAGGMPSYSWQLHNGSLPQGLSLAANGLISGTPTTTGVSNFTVKVSDSALPVATTLTKSLTITTTNCDSLPPLNIETGSPVPSGIGGHTYSTTFTASGGTGNNRWSLAGGSIPVGLTIASNGVMSGTIADSYYNQQTLFTFVVRVTDAVNGNIADKSFEMTVNTTGALAINTSTLPNATVDTVYRQSLTASNGTQPYSWMLVSGSLPPGLTLSSSGMITGTAGGPTGYTYLFTVQVTDYLNRAATKTLRIGVFSATLLTITTTTVPTGTVGTSYSVTLSATGGTLPYSWSRRTALPPGLQLSSTGIISGIPTTAGVYSFTIGVQDANYENTDKSYSVTIAGSPPPE